MVKKIIEKYRNTVIQKVYHKVRIEVAVTSEKLGAPNLPKKKFIILGQGRSGCGLLSSLLESHRMINMGKHLYGRFQKGIKEPEKYLNGLARISGKKSYGCFVTIKHVERWNNLDAEYFFQNRKKEGWKIIHLMRKNTWRQVLSGLVAIKRWKWHDYEEDKSFDKIEIDVEKMRKKIERRENDKKREKEVIKKFQNLKIVYEEDLRSESEQVKTCNRIFDFVGLNRKKVSTNMKKSTPNKLEFLLNSEEVKDVKKWYEVRF